MPFTPRHVKEVCKLGQGGTTCAFIMMGGDVQCAKGTGIEDSIRERLAQGTMNAKGDNCDGETGSVQMNEVF